MQGFQSIAVTLEKVRPEALSLSESERAELAHSLVATSTARRIWTLSKRGTRKSSAGSPRSMLAPLNSLIVRNSAAACGSA